MRPAELGDCPTAWPPEGGWALASAPLNAEPFPVDVTPVALDVPVAEPLSDWLERPVSADGSDVPCED